MPKGKTLALSQELGADLLPGVHARRSVGHAGVGFGVAIKSSRVFHGESLRTTKALK
jgi:hypothetical protein